MNDHYWRDLSIKLLGWGIATCFIVIGWTISAGEIFYFGSNDSVVVGRTYFFNIIILFVGFGWIFAINHVSSNIPAEQPHVKKVFVLLVAIGFLVITFGVAFMSSKYNTTNQNCAKLNSMLQKGSSV